MRKLALLLLVLACAAAHAQSSFVCSPSSGVAPKNITCEFRFTYSYDPAAVLNLKYNSVGRTSYYAGDPGFGPNPGGVYTPSCGGGTCSIDIIESQIFAEPSHYTIVAYFQANGGSLTDDQTATITGMVKRRAGGGMMRSH